MTSGAMRGLVGRRQRAAIRAITREFPFARATLAIRGTEAVTAPHDVDAHDLALERRTARIAQQLALAVALRVGEFHHDHGAVRITRLREAGRRCRELVGEHRAHAKLLVEDGVADLAQIARVVGGKADAIGGRTAGGLRGIRMAPIRMTKVAMNLPGAILALPDQQVLAA